jgi:predicted dehydrogenase
MSSISTLWLIGAGNVAQDYARVLTFLKQPFEVIGRGKSKALTFQKVTGCVVKIGGLKANLKNKVAPEVAIIAVGIEQLADITKDLIRSGTKRILLEKPGSLNLKEIRSLDLLARKKKVEILIAYNRRFYNSVQQMKKLIDKDGGILSVNFDFTERSHIVKNLKKSRAVKERWLIGNSSHVIDLIFHLCGRPKNWKCWNKSSLDWHPTSARFCGSGITDQGIMFSYLSDWQAPGRWGLEFMTTKHRFILRPMEQLQVIKKGSVVVKIIEPQNKMDKEFKPGLFLQTKKFIEGDSYLFCSLSEQVENMKIYYKIAGY